MGDALTPNAVAMHSEFGARALRGRLTVAGDKLNFRTADISIDLPLSGLHAEAGGQNNEHLFLRDPKNPEWTISTADPEIQKAIAAAADPELRTQVTRGLRQRAGVSRLWITAIATIGLMILAVVLLFAFKSTLARMAANRLPVSWEVQFGDAAFQSIKTQGKILETSEWAPQLAAVTNRLIKALTNSPYNFQFHVLEAKDLNAFAIPGGHIVVHTALLKAVHRPEELAGVLAHEMAHVTERHSLRNAFESAGLALIIQSLFGDASGLLAVATGSSEFLLRQKFSRDIERDADDVGWNYLLAARIDPHGMIDFFDTMKRDAAQNAVSGAVDSELSFLSTHPATPERIARLQSKLKALPPNLNFVPIANN